MAKEKVKTLTYSVDLDSSGFTNSVKSTRAEMKQARKVMRDTITPMEKYGNELAKLDHLRKKGLVSQEAYNRQLTKLRAGFKKTGKATKTLNSRMETTAANFRKVVGALALLESGRRIVNWADASVAAMDKVAKASQNLGVSSEFLTGLDFVAQRTSGFEAGQSTTAMRKFVDRIGKASVGDGEAQKTLKRLNLDAKELVRIGPEKTFFKIRDALREIDTLQEKRAAMVSLFDDEAANLVSTMQLQTDEYEKQVELARTLGKIQTEAESRRAAQAADDFQLFKAGAQGVGTKVGMEVGSGFMTYMKSVSLNQPTGNIGFNPVSAVAGAFGFGSIRENERGMAIDAGMKDVEEKRAAREKQDRNRQAAAVKGMFGQGFQRLALAFQANDIMGAGAAGFNHTDRGMTNKRLVSAGQMDDPASSIAAGSSAAFRVFNRTQSDKTVEVENQEKQINIMEQSQKSLKGIFGALSSAASDAVNL